MIISLWIQAAISAAIFIASLSGISCLKGKVGIRNLLLRNLFAGVALLMMLYIVVLLGRLDTMYNYAFDLYIGRY